VRARRRTGAGVQQESRRGQQSNCNKRVKMKRPFRSSMRIPNYPPPRA
jgi:hypothetical protein